MKVIPLVSDSMGIRSLSVYVEFGNAQTILIDGGARLAPKRYGLPPTELEKNALERYRKLLEDCVKKASIVVISHYHYDHYLPDSTDYSGKIIYVKDVERHINRSQRTRGRMFREIMKNDANVITADGKRFEHGDFSLSFSDPVPHGEDDSPLGYVLMSFIEENSTGETLLHSSDVQGPVSTKTTEKIIDLKPDMLILDGAPTYLREWKDPALMKKVDRNLMSIVDRIQGTIIMDHHNLRDREWSVYFSQPEKIRGIKTFADYHNIKTLMLESMRREIWRSEHGQD